MAYLNVSQRVLETKIVYYGAGLSGKTTNLQMIKQHARDGQCGEMMSLNTAGDRTLFFDWMPFSMGKVRGCEVKVQLYTVPGQAKYTETRRRVLKDADGIVMVLDSQSGALDRNRTILEDLRQHIADNRLDQVPVVYQLNKRDLPTAMAPDALMSALGLDGDPYFEAIAFEGKGVFETLKETTQRVLASVRQDARQDTKKVKHGDNSELDGAHLHRELDPEGKAKLVTNGDEKSRKTLVSADAVTDKEAKKASSKTNGTPPRASTQKPAAGTAREAKPVAAAKRQDQQSAPPPPNGSTVDVTLEQRIARMEQMLIQLTKSQLDGPGTGPISEVVSGHRALQRRLDQWRHEADRRAERRQAHLDAKLGDLVQKLSPLGELEATLAQLSTDVQSFEALPERMLGGQRELAHQQRDHINKRLDSLDELAAQARDVQTEELVDRLERPIKAIDANLMARIEAQTAALAQRLDEQLESCTTLIHETTVPRLEEQRAYLDDINGNQATLADHVDRIQVAVMAHSELTTDMRQQVEQIRGRCDRVVKQTENVATTAKLNKLFDKTLTDLRRDLAQIQSELRGATSRIDLQATKQETLHGRFEEALASRLDQLATAEAVEHMGDRLGTLQRLADATRRSAEQAVAGIQPLSVLMEKLTGRYSANTDDRIAALAAGLEARQNEASEALREFRLESRNQLKTCEGALRHVLSRLEVESDKGKRSWWRSA